MTKSSASWIYVWQNLMISEIRSWIMTREMYSRIELNTVVPRSASSSRYYKFRGFAKSLSALVCAYKWRSKFSKSFLTSGLSY